MTNTLRLYLAYVSISLRAQLQYRFSFVMQMLGNMLLTLADFVAVWALFDRFGAIEGWSLAEVALLYGIAAIALAGAALLGRRFQHLGELIRSGDFDRLLLRPRSLVLQVLGDQFETRQLGRALQGAVILAWAVANLGIPWDGWRLALLAAAMLGGCCLFLGLFVLQATATFWTVQGLEVFNTLTYGGETAAQYPVSFYEAWMRSFLIFVLPVACVTYFPVLAITGRADPLGSSFLLQCLAPLSGVVFLLVGLACFRLGVRHYASTGS